jgi:hypothetical protein
VTEVQQKVYDALESGRSVADAIRAMGVTRKVFYSWLKDDPSFRELVMHSDVADVVTIEDVLFVNALNGNTQDRKLFFERRAGKKLAMPAGINDELKLLSDLMP